MSRKQKDGENGTPESSEGRAFGGVAGPLTAEQKAERMAHRRSYILMYQASESSRPELVKSFDNHHQLRKWYAVAKDANPLLVGRCFIIRGRMLILDTETGEVVQ